MKLTDLAVTDADSDIVRVIVETPKGSRNKFKYLPEHDLFMLNRVIPAGLVFPFNFGFVPSTLAEDGDPLDALVCTAEPVPVGCLVLVRLIGVIEATQKEGRSKPVRNDRLIAVSVKDAAFSQWNSLNDVDGETLLAIEQFFVTYHRLQGRVFRPLARGGPRRARALLARSIRRAETERLRSRVSPPKSA